LNPMRDYLLLYLNGQALRVSGDEAFLPLSEFLRRRRRLTGTKVVCAEGDCGACAVLVGRVVDNQIAYAAVNSCIQMMFQLDGAHVISVEGLRDSPELNPIQKSMVKCHGTQCGFCTPGFVVALYDLIGHQQKVDAAAIRRGLVGNLCRCTGYDSIIRAALQTDIAALKSLDQLYPPQRIVSALTQATEQEVRVQAGDKCFYKPVDVEHAVRFRAQNPDCLIVAGATDLGVQCNKGTRCLGVVMGTGSLEELRKIVANGDVLEVGAAATLSELERAAEKYLPELAAFLQWFGSPLIRNSGTLAGNLVNGSPIGDAICALFVLETQLELRSPQGIRQIELSRFYTGYRKTVMAPDEMVTAVRIALPRPREVYKLYKISKRKDLDISSFAAAIWMRRDGRMISDIRIAYAGVAPMVVGLAKTEAILRGRALSRENFRIAAEVAAREASPISDVRGSADYRRALAANILLKFWHDLGDLSNGHNEPVDAPRGTGLLEPVLRSPDGAQ
jgi:xanthine dehydrogenase small subunit